MAAATVFLLVMIIPVLMSQESSSLLNQVITALESMVTYYQNNYRDLNIDGLFGLRVLEGHMESILQEYSSGKHQNISVDTIKRIQTMLTDATKVCKDAIYFVKRDDEEYYYTMSYIIGQPWSYFQKHKQVVPDLRWHSDVYLHHEKKVLDETSSDNCMSELTGGQGKQKCRISKECVDIMADKGLSGYGITHQILYTMLADTAGCGNTVNELFLAYGYNTTDVVQLEFCTNNLIEMTDVVHGHHRGVIVPSIQDLFLEQQFICPSLGYYQFLSKKYLDDILSWQKPNGCYGRAVTSLFAKSQNQKDTKTSKSGNLLKENVNKNVAQMEIKPNLNINTMQIGKNGIKDLLYKQKNGNKNGAILGQVLNPISVNLGKSGKIVKSLASNISVKQNGNVVMQAGGGLVGNFQESRNVFKKEGVNPFNKLSLAAINGNLGRKLLSVPSIFDARNLHGLGQNTFKSRKLQAEKQLAAGCLAHKTAVAAGALVIYLRYIIDPGPLNLGTDPEEFRQRFLMSHEFTKQSEVKGRNKNGDVLQKAAGSKEGAMNNNILAAQLHGEDRQEGDNYQDDGDYKEKGYENEMYPENEQQNVKPLQRLVQFDNKDGGVKKDNDYDEDNYNDDQDENEENENYEDHNNKDNNDGNNNNKVVNNENDKQNFNPKPDDRDYTYYDEHHHHDDYNNENEESDKKNGKLPTESFHKKENDQQAPEKFVLEDTSNVHFESPHLPKGIFLFILISSLALIVFMYRFIKNRRIHIRYHPRSFIR